MKYDSTLYVGLDVHQDSLTVACVGSASDDPVIDVGTIDTEQYAIDQLSTKYSGSRSLDTLTDGTQ
jgi:hypothetical protein